MSDQTKSTVLMKAKPHALSVSIDTMTSYSFDRKGRLIGAYVDGINYKRGLDNSVLRKWSTYGGPGPHRHRRKLEDNEKREFFHEMTKTLEHIREFPDEYTIETPEGRKSTCRWLERAVEHNFDALEADAEKIRRIYKPVSILPPDQYYSLVLQITEGCSYNKCTFCNFYQDRRFRIKSPEDVKNHICAVTDFFGESLGLRKSVFLADANALIMPQRRLLEMLEIIRDSYTIIADDTRKKEIARRRRAGEAVFDGIYSFIDLFTGDYKSETQFREMAELGVRRAYIGMESGSKALLEFLEKPGSKAEMVGAVNKIKAGGVDVGAIVLLGAGGKDFDEIHVEETVDALNRMRLDTDDFIYFSDFYPQEETRYETVAAEAGIEPMSWEDRRNQEQRIRAGLRYQDPKTGPKIIPYDIREFLY